MIADQFRKTLDPHPSRAESAPKIFPYVTKCARLSSPILLLALSTSRRDLGAIAELLNHTFPPLPAVSVLSVCVNVRATKSKMADGAR